MTALALYAANLAAILVLVLGLYFPRHRRRDLVVAFIGVNVGVMAVSAALLHVGASIGLGLGLFGVLSIIRLRSDELAQHEVAYYFSALALGLLAGLHICSLTLTLSLMTVIVTAMALADHPRLLAGYERQIMVLDRAFTDQTALVAHLEQLLGARVYGVTVQRVDVVSETTWVEVRFRAPQGVTSAAPIRDRVEVAR